MISEFRLMILSMLQVRPSLDTFIPSFSDSALLRSRVLRSPLPWLSLGRTESRRGSFPPAGLRLAPRIHYPQH